MKFNIKSKKGFTLIELLVVIGILAVLAAIAIPSVAGLIDRANVSADNTNANEMTNAMERFVSEYELFRQDIASGTFDVNNMDAAQGRVYNVTGADSIEDIRALESEAGFNGIRIDIDNKYAQNHATAKAVIENYMKTSSSTFEPKQSDMTYWYNKTTGYTIVAEKDIDTSTLNSLLPQDIKYNKSNPASFTEWIDLSSKYIAPDIEVCDYFLNYESSISGYALCMTFKLPNPKYNPDIDTSKIYFKVRLKDSLEGGILNKDTAPFICLSSYNSLLAPITKDVITINAPAGPIPESYFDSEFCLRMMLEYEEDGVIRYLYTPTITVTCNELLNK